MGRITVKDIANGVKSMTKDRRGRVYTAVLADDAHKELFFVTRYDSIHRLMTHCNNRPKMFRCRGIKIYTTKED